MLVRRPCAAALALASVVAFATSASATPVIVPTSVANAIQGKGQGLCVANAVSMNPATDFPQQAGVFNAGINGFLEAPAQKAIRVEYVQRTVFDLSNNQDTGPKISWGDFTDAMSPQCQTGGCDFHWNDTTTSFASRFRGFLNVTSALAGKPLHIGFYADDAVSLTFYDNKGNSFPTMIQPPVLGAPTWRLTETVTFMQEGLVPLEILYVQIVEHAALEMSFFDGTFTDFQQPANQVPITSLNSAGFTLFPVTSFFQTLSGAPSYPDLDTCKQCDRQFVGQFGNNGCDKAYYCNEAALCAPCDTAIYCGPSCSPCGGMTPFCININGQSSCGQCRTDTDCKAGFSCDPVTHVCNQCNIDADCPRGQECDAHACTWCATAGKCAGNSCNCCPNGPTTGTQMQCAVLPADAGAPADGGTAALASPPECVECVTENNPACPSGTFCDTKTGLCITTSLASEVSAHESPGCCGPDCLNCETGAGACLVDGTKCMPGLDQCCSGNCVSRTLEVGQPPVNLCEPLLCLPGPYGTACATCRNDMECSDESFCIQGQCSACTTNRHCGARCQSCSGDTPFCLTATVASDATCVRCNQDSDCTGGHCDPTTHDCAPSCAMTCAPATPYCDGQDCVECYADTQCPCGNTCDLGSHTCSTNCNDNGDCQGDQHCHYTPDGTAKTCSPGALPDNADCGGTLADLCGSSIGARGSHPTPSAGILALSLAALLLRRLRRREGER